MKWSNSCRIRLVSVGFVAALGWTTGSANADFTFGTPQNLGPVVNTASSDGSNCTSADDLELYFASTRLGGFGRYDLYMSTRQSINDPWGPPTNLGPTVNSPYDEVFPSLSSDGLTLYFSDEALSVPARPGGLGGCDIWMSTRATRSAPWTTPVNVGAPINSFAEEVSPSISGDGLLLVFSSERPGGLGGNDIWMTTRATLQEAWGPPVNLGPSVNSSNWEEGCSVSADGLAVFFMFASYSSDWDLFVSTRKSRNDPWGQRVNLGPVVNSAANEYSPGISSDMRTLYFNSPRPGGFGDDDLYAAPIIPIVDFNSDGKVDIKDLLILIEHWGQADPLCDIGPAPWGDGKVDEKDLEVLMNYWGARI